MREKTARFLPIWMVAGYRREGIGPEPTSRALRRCSRLQTRHTARVLFGGQPAQRALPASKSNTYLVSSSSPAEDARNDRNRR
jgi:hypothetical protein